MCLTSKETPNTRNYRMEYSNIQDIITKSILEEASSEELVMLENWRRESADNENLYQEYAAIWNASANYSAVDFQSKSESAYQKHLDLLSKEDSNVIQLNPNNSSNSNSSGSSDHSPSTQPTTKFFTLSRVASIAALFVLAFGAMVVFNTMNTTTINAENGVVFASLEDGSSVWLDEGSSLTYTKGFGSDHRNVALDGKAFFDVERNEAVAFNISSNDINVSVLGTSFTVDTKEDKNIVSVKTGKVSVKGEDQEVILTADQKAVFENNKFTQLASSLDDVAWRNSNLSFDNAPLNQVISDINLYHKNKIVLKNDVKDLDCPFTARSLANTSFENIVEILKITYDLEVENQENGDISLTISECK